jgi:ribosomal protein S12 methylthiotransferase accessory factor YcaO
MRPNPHVSSLKHWVAKIKESHAHENIAVMALQREFECDCWHFEVRSELSKISGWGDDRDSLIALQKAYSEFIERNVYVQKGFASTNGLACGSTRELATQSARLEFQERDAVMVTWLAKRPPTWLSDGDFFAVSSPWVQSTRAVIERSGAVLRLGVLASTTDGIVTVAAIDSRNAAPVTFGGVFGFAAAHNLHSGFEHCVREISRYYAHIVARWREGVHPSGNSAPLALTDATNPESHFQFLLHPENFHHIEWYFENSNSVLKLPPFIIDVKEIHSQVNSWCSLATMHATSAFGQQPFWGTPHPSCINIHRFEQIGLSPIIRSENHPLA